MNPELITKDNQPVSRLVIDEAQRVHEALSS